MTPTGGGPATEQHDPEQNHLKETEDGPGAWPFVVGFVAPIILVFLFWAGFEAVNRADPQTGAARGWYMVTFAAGAGAVVTGAQLRPRGRLTVLAWGLGLAVPVAVFVAALAQDAYGWGSVFAFYFFTLMYLAAEVAHGAAVGILAAMRGGNAAADAAVAGGVALSGGMAMAAMYHIMTLSDQADRARLAHEAPGPAVLVLLFFVVVAAVLVRRRQV